MILKEDAVAHVTFDCDGTLIDSGVGFLQTLKKILPKHLGREFTMEELKAAQIPEWTQLLKNLGVKEPSRELISKLSTEASEFSLLRSSPPLFAGIKKLISELLRQNVACYVWTARDRKSALKILKEHEILSFFTEMQFCDTSISKPHPAGLEVMLEGIDNSKVVHVGDSIVDIQGAKNYRIPCIAVNWDKEHNPKDFLEYGACYVAHKPVEVLSWVQENLLN